MNRTVVGVDLGDGTTRWTLRIDDDTSESHQAQNRLGRFLQSIVDQPLLLQCGATIPMNFTVEHDGRRWILRAQTTTENA